MTDCSAAVGNSTCSNTSSTCSCLTAFYASNNNTHCTLRKIDDLCNSNSQCSEAVTNSECHSGTCSCEDGYKVTTELDTCILLTVGDNCTTTSQCERAVNNSMCDTTGSCGCVTGYASHSNNTECLLNQILSPCTFNAECFQAVSNSSCVNATCACDMGFYSTKPLTRLAQLDRLVILTVKSMVIVPRLLVTVNATMVSPISH